ncbi:MAG: hypothetical protein JWP81_2119 [Ferruginibacter sp.]|nr:hypothetical protein [Ferruginibacter sp.]
MVNNKREVYFYNIPDEEFIQSSIAVKKGYAEINYLLAFFERNATDRKYVAAQIIYCETRNCFFKIIGANNNIIIERLNATVDEFDNIYNSYCRYFVQFDPVTYQSFEASEMEIFRQTWQKVFDFFIQPFGSYLNNDSNVNILLSLSDIKGRKYVFDFSTIFDLQFRFFPIQKNINSYVLSVSGTGMVDFAENLVKLFRPVSDKTVILYGFDKHYSETALPGAPEVLRSMAMGREKLYDSLLSNATIAGARVVHLEKNDDLLKFLRKGWEGYLVQILTHYEKMENGGRMFFKKKSIQLDIFLKLIDRIKQEDGLRNDIVIDAVTCTNFFDFKSLYNKGFKYIYLSHHDIDTDQAAFVLNELYTGVNANLIKWDFPYLNGKHYLHEARSNVLRCFFSICQQGLSILTP